MIRDRVLKVTLALPGGDVTLDQTNNMRVRAHKNPLFIQNKATIEITNMTQAIRQQLLSNFTAWNKNQRDRFGGEAPFVDVTIVAGYISDDGTDTSSVIYKGQVVQVDPIGAPPNYAIRISCYTHQIDRTRMPSDPLESPTTFRNLVLTAGGIMGFDAAHIKCNTRYDDKIIYNPARSIVTAQALLPYIQDYYHPRVVAFIDDDFLIVKNLDGAINPTDIATLNEFIGVPTWNEWGVEGVVFLDPSIRVASGVKFVSTQNPSLNGEYVVSELEYELSTRDTQFYVRVTGIPPSASVLEGTDEGA